TVEDNGSGAANSPVSITIQFTVTAPAAEPQIAVNTTNIAVSFPQGQDAASVTFQVWNGGTGTLHYKLVEYSSNYGLSPTTGSSTGSADKQTHTLTFTTSGMPAGIQTRTFTVEDNGSGAVNSPQTVTIEFNVNPVIHNPFTAYNDLSWSAGQPSVNITRISAWNMNGLVNSGELVDHESGAGVGVMLTVRTASSYHSAWQAQGADAAAGTDADDVFGGVVGLAGLVSGGDMAFIFSGLNPSNRYEVALFGNRDEPSYTGRLASFTISDVAAFANRSSAGTILHTQCMTNDTTELCTGYNTGNGRVARFGDIDPGPDGCIAVSMTSTTGGRYVNGIRLRTVQPDGTDVVRAPAGDVDGDAIPDAWEADQFAGSDGSSASPWDDPDNDGLDNMAEYVAGTAPTDGASCFAVGVTLSDGHPVVAFRALAAEGAGYEGRTRHYALETCALAEGAWTAVPGYEDITAAGQLVQYQVQGSAGGFYRARVWLNP
ncbi:MAG: hypothetical protein JXR37_23300, partial [Kiritimatiellae bacterium]|nr:hypothetical protein [Kiritimatiellia bacterium]